LISIVNKPTSLNAKTPFLKVFLSFRKKSKSQCAILALEAPLLRASHPQKNSPAAGFSRRFAPSALAETGHTLVP
jgi:hypothetical protein